MKTKGMRSLETIRTRRNRAKPSSRTDMATRLARLEAEKMRLKRELEIFDQKRDRTAQKLSQIDDRIAGLRRSLYDDAPSGGSVRKEGSTLSPIKDSAAEAEDEGEKEKEVNVVTLDY